MQAGLLYRRLRTAPEPGIRMNTDKDHTPTDYSELSPDTLLNAIDSCGLQTDGRLLALNSYENRVYQAGIESEAPVIAKFYRPGRWTDAAIL